MPFELDVLVDGFLCMCCCRVLLLPTSIFWAHPLRCYHHGPMFSSIHVCILLVMGSIAQNLKRLPSRAGLTREQHTVEILV